MFQLQQHGTNLRTEVVAGTTTFLAMVYIVFVNPQILGQAGIDPGAAFVATCLAAMIGSAIMGFAANLPIALAPGMGLNAYFTYGVVLGLGHSWEVALGAVFLSGCLFLLLSLVRLREWIIDSIPRSLKLGISTGIGLFLGLIALKNAGIVVDHPSTLVTLGNVKRPEVWLAAGGFIVMVALDAHKVPGAILIAILGTTATAVYLKLTPLAGIAAPPPSLTPTLLQLDIAGAFDIGLVTIVFAFLFVDLFDTAGTLIGVGHAGKMLDSQGRLPRLGRALLADSTATLSGSLLGTSTTTSYIESTLGIQAGGKTGLTAVTVAVLFGLCLFFEPLARTVPIYATAPALLYVACLMARGLRDLDWDDVTETAPALLAAIAMPFTFSISTGIGLGFLAHVGIKILALRWRDLNLALLVLAALFVTKFWIL